jgi:hypothetical protein
MKKIIFWMICFLTASAVCDVAAPFAAGNQEPGMDHGSGSTAGAINSLDSFYSSELTKGYDIRDLEADYDVFDAQKDNCFVIGAMVHHDSLYSGFMDAYADQRDAFIRVAQNTAGGDLFLYDILYHPESAFLYLVTDQTRNTLLAEADRQIELRQFEHTAEYTYKDHLYWILYNGEVDDSNFESADVFILATIN